MSSVQLEQVRTNGCCRTTICSGGRNKNCLVFWIYGYPHLSLHKSDEGLNKLDEWLLTLMTRLGARRRWFGLGGGEDGAGRRWWRAPPEMAGEAWEKSAQFWAELLLEPLFVSREDGRIFEAPNSLRDQHVETVLHCEHQEWLQCLDLLWWS